MAIEYKVQMKTIISSSVPDDTLRDAHISTVAVHLQIDYRHVYLACQSHDRLFAVANLFLIMTLYLTDAAHRSSNVCI